jgi:hypothetical protein
VNVPLSLNAQIDQSFYILSSGKCYRLAFQTPFGTPTYTVNTTYDTCTKCHQNNPSTVCPSPTPTPTTSQCTCRENFTINFSNPTNNGVTFTVEYNTCGGSSSSQNISVGSGNSRVESFTDCIIWSTLNIIEPVGTSWFVSNDGNCCTANPN